MTNLNPKVSWIVFGIFVVLILVISGYYCYRYFRDTNKSLDTTTVTNPTSITVTSSEIAGWKTYTNKNYGFSFSYPKDIVVFEDDSTNTKSISLFISTEKIATIGFQPNGYDYDNAIADKAAIEKGDPTVRVSWPVHGSNKLLNIGGAIGKEFTVLMVYDTTDVGFEKTAVIYHGDDRIIIGLDYNDIDKIVQENLGYFMKDEYGTTNSLVWKNNPDGTQKFYNDLVAGKTGPISQNWYKNFDEIITTLKFN